MNPFPQLFRSSPRKWSWLAGFVLLMSLSAAKAQEEFVGPWLIELEVQQDRWLSVQLHIDASQDPAGGLEATLSNGPEQIDIPISGDAQNLTLDFPHYDSRIVLQAERSPDREIQKLIGYWTKVRGADKVAKMNCRALRATEPSLPQEETKPFEGRFRVKFADDEDPAVAIFRSSPNLSNGIEGTILTTTGDYRFLAGSVQDSTLTLSSFDGGHAFLFQIRVDSEKETSDSVAGPARLQGVFYSGNWYEVNFTAVPDAEAQLPDGFAQTTLTDEFAQRSMLDLADLEVTFPDLAGRLQRLDSKQFYGKVTLIEVFGSWCPNCHDEAELLNELQQEYGDSGLKILGLAFELTGDIDRDTHQVRAYVDRHAVDYPILIVGTSDKALASQKLPWIDQLRSYPTTLFIDKAGKIRSIYTGFSGPATGESHLKLRKRFRALVEELLAE